MEHTDINNPVWRNLVTSKTQVNLGFLAANVLLTRLKMELRHSQSDDDIRSASKSIFDLYMQNQQLPTVKKDIAALLGRSSN